MGRYKKPYTLFKRGKFWYYRTYTVFGERTTAKSTGQTLKSRAVEYCEGLYLRNDLTSSNITFYEFAHNFYDDDGIYLKDRAVPVALNTKLNYQRVLKNQVLPYFKDYKITDINYLVIKKFRSELIEKGTNGNYINTIISNLKHIIDTAFRSGIITKNPFDYLEPIPVKQNTRDGFTLEEVRYIYHNIDDEFKESCLIMALCGLRISEVAGLNNNTIIDTGDFKYIDLTTQVALKEVKKPKGNKTRAVPIIDEIAQLSPFDDSRRSKFYKVFNILKESIPNYQERNLSFHSFRHFFITNTKASGIISSKVEFIVGHSLKGIEKVYTQYKPSDLIDILPWQKMTLEKIKIPPELTTQAGKSVYNSKNN